MGFMSTPQVSALSFAPEERYIYRAAPEERNVYGASESPQSKPQRGDMCIVL